MRQVMRWRIPARRERDCKPYGVGHGDGTFHFYACQ